MYGPPVLARLDVAALPCGAMRVRWPAILLASLVLSVTGCARAAALIPGHNTTPTPRSGATPGPISAPPLLAPGSLRLAGSAGGAANRPAIADNELGKMLFVVQTLDDGGKPLRSGGGVLVDRGQQLVLTSYSLVKPYQANGAKAYATLAAGPASSTGAIEFNTILVAANPNADIAVLRVVGTRDGATTPPAASEAVLADSSSLRRGDRLRFLAQPSPTRQGPIQVTNGGIVGFSGDGLGESRAFIKGDVRLMAGTVGSPVFDQSGALIGIASQLSYDAAAPVAVVRPLARAIEAINQAKSAPPTLKYSAPLEHSPSLSGATTSAAARDGVVVAKPVFAEGALEGQGFRDLLDYTNIFKREAPELDYEYLAQGVPQGALVQELWYLNGTLQDSLSSSYTWTKGPFAVVSDRLTTPSSRGVPNGTWTMEVWVAGTVRATSTAYVGITPPDVPRKPTVEGLRFASNASAEQLPGDNASSGAGQILMFFDYRQAAAVQSIRWVVLKDGRAIYQSPPVPWAGGEKGTWWVGMPAETGGVGAGAWEIQIYMDNQSIGSAKTTLR